MWCSYLTFYCGSSIPYLGSLKFYLGFKFQTFHLGFYIIHNIDQRFRDHLDDFRPSRHFFFHYIILRTFFSAQISLIEPPKLSLMLRKSWSYRWSRIGESKPRLYLAGYVFCYDLLLSLMKGYNYESTNKILDPNTLALTHY